MFAKSSQIINGFIKKAGSFADDVFKALDKLIAIIKKGADHFASFIRQVLDDFFEWLKNLFKNGKADEVLENGVRLPIKIVIGKFSKRPFDINNCGGKIVNLTWKDAKITKEGIETVKKHLSRFETVTANKKMISRLEKIKRREIAISDWDKKFYTHEIREYERYKAMGIKDGVNIEEHYNNLHTATLEDFKLAEFDENGIDNIYHPEVEEIDFHF